MRNSRHQTIVSWLLVVAPALMFAQQPASPVPSTGPSMSIMGRFGPYSGINTPDDARQLSLAGFDLVLPSNFSSVVRAALATNGVAYIDLGLWTLIHTHCSKSTSAQTPPACAFSESDEQEILLAARRHIDEVKENRNLVGFWVLDDYPGGDISKLLRSIRKLVHEAAASAGRDLPTICGVQGALAVKKSANAAFSFDRRWVDRGMANISPAACDFVAPYAYGATPQASPEYIDWSLRDVIPYTIGLLQQKGFRTSSVVIPIIQAFGSCERRRSPRDSCFPAPRPADILVEAKAWTDAGAVAMMFFTWGSLDADEKYANSPEIKDGVQQAAAYFRAHHH